jgi:hypothetical protein
MAKGPLACWTKLTDVAVKLVLVKVPASNLGGLKAITYAVDIVSLKSPIIYFVVGAAPPPPPVCIHTLT